VLQRTLLMKPAGQQRPAGPILPTSDLSFCCTLGSPALLPSRRMICLPSWVTGPAFLAAAAAGAAAEAAEAAGGGAAGAGGGPSLGAAAASAAAAARAAAACAARCRAEAGLGAL
jgi:hypothetical protein